MERSGVGSGGDGAGRERWEGGRGRRASVPSAGPLAAVAAVVAACGGAAEAPAPPGEAVTLEARASGTDQLLQAVSPATGDVVWVSGHGGVYARSLDGGRTWTVALGPGGDSLQFRDVHALDARTAWLLSAGNGPASRIYRTDDGGATWTLQFIGQRPEVFLDCLDFWDAERGVAYGDAVDGVLFVLLTDDGGRTWRRVPASALPPAQEGEGGFAASGTCVRTGGAGEAWIATGNAAVARVLRTRDGGRSWTAVEVPGVEGGSAAGLTTLDMLADGRRGWALGGRLGADSVRTRNVVRTTDGGATWAPGGTMELRGPVYGSAVAPGTAGPVVVAVGPGGLDVSTDGGRTWALAHPATHWAVAFGGDGRGWAVGPGGRITEVRVAGGGR